MIQVNRIYLIFNRLVTKKFLVDTSEVKNEMIEELLRWDISTHDPLPIPRQRYRFRRNEHNYLFH